MVDERAREAATVAAGDRVRAYQLLIRWAASDTVLDDALNSVGLLISMKEDLEERGEVQQAGSIDRLLIRECQTGD